MSTTQYDLEVLQTIDAVSTLPTQLSISSMVSSSRGVTGLQKAVQRYLITLLTSVGSSKFSATFGTRFWAGIQAGAAQNAGQLAAAFNFASFDALQILKRADRDTANYGVSPPEEHIAAVQLVDYGAATLAGGVYLKLAITSEAGTLYNYQLPVTFLGSS